MKVNFNGLEFSFHFRHQPREGITAPGKNEPRGTMCRIFKLEPEGKRTLVAEGVASCSPQDNFVKETGRKISLGRALASHFRTPGACCSKKMRAAFWKAYFERGKADKNDPAA